MEWCHDGRADLHEDLVHFALPRPQVTDVITLPFLFLPELPLLLLLLHFFQLPCLPLAVYAVFKHAVELHLCTFTSIPANDSSLLRSLVRWCGRW